MHPRDTILSASNISSMQGKNGKSYYSSVLAITKKGTVVLSDISTKNYNDTKYIEICTCINLLDLNGDGLPEIILNGEGRENNWTEVWAVVGGKLTMVLVNGNGA